VRCRLQTIPFGRDGRLKSITYERDLVIEASRRFRELAKMRPDSNMRKAPMTRRPAETAEIHAAVEIFLL